MALEISSIHSEYIRNIALKVDDGDGKLSGKEYKIFAQEARKAGVEYDAIKCYSDMNAVQSWWYDMDKVCTDEADDGKLHIGEIAESTVKGFVGNTIKSIVNHPIMTGVTVALSAGLLKLTKGAAAPVLVALGTTLGIGSIAVNGIKAACAKTDAEAKEAWEGVGTGLFATATSVAGAKSALHAGAKGGVESAFGGKYMNPFKATIQCFKATPEAIKVSSANLAASTKISALAIGLPKNPIKTPQQIEQHVLNTQKYGFEIRPEQEAYFNEQMAIIEKDSWGGKTAVEDMKKVMVGLEKLNFEGNMTVQGYSDIAKTVDMPRNYWSAAIRIYNQCAKNADANKTWAVVSEYLSDVQSINSVSNTYGAASNAAKYFPIAGISTVANGQ